MQNQTTPHAVTTMSDAEKRLVAAIHAMRDTDRLLPAEIEALSDAATLVKLEIPFEERVQILARGIEDIEIPNISDNNLPQKIREAYKKHGDALAADSAKRRAVIRVGALAISGALAAAATGGGTAAIIPALVAALKLVTESIRKVTTTEATATTAPAEA